MAHKWGDWILIFSSIPLLQMVFSQTGSFVLLGPEGGQLWATKMELVPFCSFWCHNSICHPHFDKGMGQTHEHQAWEESIRIFACLISNFPWSYLPSDIKLWRSQLCIKRNFMTTYECVDTNDKFLSDTHRHTQLLAPTPTTKLLFDSWWSLRWGCLCTSIQVLIRMSPVYLLYSTSTPLSGLWYRPSFGFSWNFSHVLLRTAPPKALRILF